jgi:hypothetical protein
VYVGAPKLSKSAAFGSSIYSVADGREYYAAGGPETGLDRSVFLHYDVEDGNNYFLGWKASFKGRDYHICGKSCEMDNGLLVYRYILADRRFCYARKRYNPYFSGMALLGRVLKTEKAVVRLKLDIDKTQAVETAYPWPWTPETGNLMYLMPEIGSRVSLYFGDDDEANGRAIHCVRENAPAPPPPRVAAAPVSSPQSAAAQPSPPQPAEPSQDEKGKDFSPEDRSLTNTYGKSLFLEPGSVGITSRGSNVMLDGDDVRINTAHSYANIYIMANENITIKGKTVTLQSNKPFYSGYGGYGAPALVYLCQGSLTVGNDGAVDIDPKAIMQASSDAGGEVVVFAKQFTHFMAYEPTAYPRILDDPEEGFFDNGKFWTNVLIGVVIVVVISAVTLGVGALAGLAGCSLALLGGSVLGTGLFYVGNKALADYQMGVVSDWQEYAMAALIGSAIGLMNALTPFLPGVGTSFIATVGTAFAVGTSGNLLDQLLLGEEIDWSKALTAGAFSALLSAVLFGVCFVAGTPVLTANGIVAIEDIKPGDLVCSEDRATGEKGLKRVLRTFANTASELVHVCAGGQTISGTPGHPFYVTGKGWTSAGQLCAGDELVLQSGGAAVVESVRHERLDAPVAVYNFEVEGWHTYYVGDGGVLVHNKCVDTRINTSNEGMKHVTDGHFNRPLANSRSVFSINEDELIDILHRPDIVKSAVRDLGEGQYVRTVDVGQVVGNTALKYGGVETTWIRIFTDSKGNLLTVFPIPAP